jgi:hypothetical protein
VVGVEVEGRAQHAVGAEPTKQGTEHADVHRIECLGDKGQKWVHAVNKNYGENLEKEPISLNMFQVLPFLSKFFGNPDECLEHDPAGENGFGDPIGGDGCILPLALGINTSNPIDIRKDVMGPARGFRHPLYHRLQIAGANAVGTPCYGKVESPAVAKPFQKQPCLSSTRGVAEDSEGLLTPPVTGTSNILPVFLALKKIVHVWVGSVTEIVQKEARFPIDDWNFQTTIKSSCFIINRFRRNPVGQTGVGKKSSDFRAKFLDETLDPSIDSAYVIFCAKFRSDMQLRLLEDPRAEEMGLVSATHQTSDRLNRLTHLQAAPRGYGSCGQQEGMIGQIWSTTCQMGFRAPAWSIGLVFLVCRCYSEIFFPLLACSSWICRYRLYTV